MHVGSCMVFAGRAPSYAELVAQLERRLPLVPRYRQKLAFPPLGLARPVWVDDPHFNLALPRPPHRAAAARRRGGAAPAGGPRVLPAARPRQAAVGAVARRRRGRGPLRAHLQDPPLPRRRRLGGRHRHGALRRGARPAGRAPARRRGSRAPSRRAPRCSTDAAAELAAVAGRARARAPGRARASAAGRRGERLGGRRPRGVRPRRPRPRAALAAERAHRPAPALRLGGRRPRGLQGGQGGARRNGQRRRARRRRRRAARATCSATASAVAGLELKALVPVSVRADAERGALGNRVAAVYAPLPRRRAPTRSGASARCTTRCAG